MMYPHVIRLREPWGRSELDSRVRHRRSFNWLNKLDQREQLWLVVESVADAGEFVCNDTLLGQVHQATSLAEFEITDLISAQNEITIDIAGRQRRADSPSIGAVRLEVRLGPVSVTASRRD